jgi:hypothetical protein
MAKRRWNSEESIHLGRPWFVQFEAITVRRGLQFSLSISRLNNLAAGCYLQVAGAGGNQLRKLGGRGLVVSKSVTRAGKDVRCLGRALYFLCRVSFLAIDRAR